MKKKIHNGYITKLLDGEIKYNPIGYIATTFLIFIWAISFWYELPGSLDNAIYFLSPIGFIGILILVILILSNGSGDGKTPVTIDRNDLLNKTDTLLDILPIKKESIITTHYFIDTLVILEILSFNILGLLILGKDSSALAIRGLLLLSTMLLCSIMTYKNIKKSKIIRERYSTKKDENNVLSLFIAVAYFSFFVLGEKLFEFIASKNEALIESIYNFIINASPLNFIGSFYVSLILIVISITLAIYFNYYYRIKKKLTELKTISNWREL